MCDIGLKAKSTPQGLKRGLIIQRSDGTNEFVPFPNLLELEFFRSLRTRAPPERTSAALFPTTLKSCTSRNHL
jgi:hypothetical protein